MSNDVLHEEMERHKSSIEPKTPIAGRALVLGQRIVVKTLVAVPRHCIYRGKLTRFELLWPIPGTVEIFPGQTIG